MTNPPGGGGANTIVCTVCSAENPAGSRFCERCGTRLPQSPRQESPASETAVAPPIPRAEATVTFNRLPVDPFAEPPAAEPPARAVAPKAAEPAAADPAEAAAPPPEPPPDRESLRNAATMSFELPELPEPTTSAPPRALPAEERNAPTMSFDLPTFDPAPGSPAPPPAPSPEPPPSRGEGRGEDPQGAGPPPEGMRPGETGWNYQSWKPQSPAERAAQAATPPAEGAGGTRRSIPVPPATPPGEQAARPADAAPPPRQTGYQAQPPGWYGPPPGTTAPPEPRNITYPTPGGAQPPAQGGFGQGLGPAQSAQVPPAGQQAASAYAPAAPGVGPYPTPAAGGSNRTLWIILGVVGGLLLLCAMICVLVILVSAASASSAAPVATSIATATRP